MSATTAIPTEAMVRDARYAALVEANPGQTDRDKLWESLQYDPIFAPVAELRAVCEDNDLPFDTETVRRDREEAWREAEQRLARGRAVLEGYDILYSESCDKTLLSGDWERTRPLEGLRQRGVVGAVVLQVGGWVAMAEQACFVGLRPKR